MLNNRCKTISAQVVEEMLTTHASGKTIIVLRGSSRRDLLTCVSAFINSRSYNPSSPITPRDLVNSLGWCAYSYAGGAPGRHVNHNVSFVSSADGLESALEACENGNDAMKGMLFFLPDLTRFTGTDPSQRSDEQHALVSRIERIALNKLCDLNNCLIVTGSTDGMICPELAAYARVIEIPYPDTHEIRAIINDECQNCAGSANELRPSLANQLADAMRGLREDNIRDIIRTAYALYQNPMLGEKNILDIIHQKKMEQIASIPALNWVRSGQHGKIAGLDMLRIWLERQCISFMHPLLAGIQMATPPIGVMITGLPGTGKTTFACLAAEILMTNKMPLPVISLDPSSLLNSFVGASESNFRMATMAVEGIAPAVLVINEFEKFFDRSQNDNTRAATNLHSQFLQWMEKPKRNPVLVIATVNRPELIPEETKSRFNEIFFAGVPSAAECRNIARVHIARYAPVLEDEDDVDSIADFFIIKAAQYGKFVNGRNIHHICQGAFNEAFHNYAAALTAERRELLQAMDGSEKHRYTADAIKSSMASYLKNTVAFFNSNMDMAAAQWLQMHDLQYRSASSLELLPADAFGFDRRTNRFSGLGIAPTDRNYIQRLNELASSGCEGEPADIVEAMQRYDRQLRCALAARIAEIPAAEQ